MRRGTRLIVAAASTFFTCAAGAAGNVDGREELVVHAERLPLVAVRYSTLAPRPEQWRAILNTSLAAYAAAVLDGARAASRAAAAPEIELAEAAEKPRG